jgi:hypothetical protein
MGIVIKKTSCSAYTILNGDSGQPYVLTIANINGVYTQSWNVTDNANVVINFVIDGVYTLTATQPNLFTGNCATIAVNTGGATHQFVTYIIPAQYVAPSYTGSIITIVIQATLTYTFTYTIQNSDSTIALMYQNIANYINGLALTGVTAVVSGGFIQINVPTNIITNGATMTICGAIWTQLLWSTCNIWKCIQYLINKIFCCKKGKCDEHTEKMQKERDELNRIMLLYTQFSMMNDVERWDYLPLSLGTNIQNNLFDKLNVITARCAHCCKDNKHKKREENECDECNPQPSTVQEWCQKLPPEIVNLVGPATIIIS